jgi:hypothetical protein
VVDAVAGVVAQQAAFLAARVEVFDIEAVRVVDAAARIANGNDVRPRPEPGACAVTEPTLPKPCTATVGASQVNALALARLAVMYATPRPVASMRP